MAPTPDGKGYWFVAADGGIFTYGDAAFYGSTGSLTAEQAGSRHGRDARRQGLLAGGLRRRDLQLRRRGVLRIDRAAWCSTSPSWPWLPTPDGNGYWLAASDGGIFSFGTTTFFGSGPQLVQGVTDFNSFAAATDGAGYIMGNASRGYLLNFGDARYTGIGFNPADASPLAGLTQPVATANYSYWDATQAGGVELNDPGATAGAATQTSC